MYEVKVAAVFLSAVDLSVDQRIAHRLEDGHRGPLAPDLTLKRIVIYHFLSGGR
jgi:hypothetical protein